ncbi:MAG: COX15/CtaA family protein [Flavobacteriales bacterium]|nr:COX15/CtaA family protein [Flavobacteriales bacterium]
MIDRLYGSIGGVTRLTGSGLSITEWKPIMGALPPMNDTEWHVAFEKYKLITEYTLINQHMTLSDFRGSSSGNSCIATGAA